MNVLQIIAKISGTDGTVPEWILLFAEGMGELETGEKFMVDRSAFDQVATHMASRGIDIVMDYEHQTLSQEKAPAAGWISALRYDDGAGIMAKVDWTQEAAGYIAKKEYRYFSPVFAVRKSDLRVVGLHSVALTNSPKTNNLQPIVAKLAGPTPAEQGDTHMELSVLIAKLGLPANATEADVIAKIGELVSQTPKTVEVVAKSVKDALGLTDSDDVSTVVASIHALKQSEKGMVSKADFDALTKKLLDRDVTEIVAKAMNDGKITPDQKEWAIGYATSDLRGFETFIAKAPVVIPVKKIGEYTQEQNDTAKIDDITLQVAKSMDLSEDDLKKYA